MGMGSFKTSASIEKEKIDAFARESGLPFTVSHARRNLVTEGVDLNALAGRDFLIGEVRIRGIRLCEPCSYLATTSFPETLKGLVHKGGLRAQILTEGCIRRYAISKPSHAMPMSEVMPKAGVGPLSKLRRRGRSWSTLNPASPGVSGSSWKTRRISTLMSGCNAGRALASHKRRGDHHQAVLLDDYG